MAQQASTSLPKQEDNLLKQALRLLDNKDFAKCFKHLEQILAKYPTNADSLAVKSLAIQGQQHQIKEYGKRKDDKHIDDKYEDDDAIATCKTAIQGNMKSVMAWHAMGNLHKADKNFGEALKAYKMALRVEAATNQATEGGGSSPAYNANLTRDATSMMIQQRDWDGLVECRQRALGIKSDIRVNWTAYSVAHYMAGNVELASAIADTLCKVMDTGDTPAEVNEMLLYRAELKLELKDTKAAIQIMGTTQQQNDNSNAADSGNSNSNNNNNSQLVCSDRPEKHKILARAYQMQKNKKQAKKHLEALLELREGERDVLFQLAALEGIALEPVADPDGGCSRQVPSSAAFCTLLDDVLKQFPRCDPAKRLALDYCDVATPEGEADFTSRLKTYIVPFIVKLIPSLVTVLESLYVNPTKVKLIETQFLKWRDDLEKGNDDDFEKKKPSTADATQQHQHRNPTFLLAVHEFLSSHYLLKRDYANAHASIDKAIAHTPTHEVLYLRKARIFNAEHKSAEAAKFADKAQLLDKQDKYLNNKSAQYWIRAGEIEEGEDRLAMFFKPSPNRDAYLQSFELQYTWYERELGNAFLHQKKDYISALQALLLVEKHQRDNHDELSDFHTYTMRRNNVRSWIDVIRTEDNFSGTNHFLQACPSIVAAYVGVHDVGGPEKAKELHKPREKLLYPNDADEQKRMDKMFENLVLRVDVSDPLEKALPYVRALQKHRKNDIKSHEAAFDVHLRAGRILPCVSAMCHVRRIVVENRVAPKEAGEELLSKMADRLKPLYKKDSGTCAPVVAEMVSDALFGKLKFDKSAW